MTAPTKSQIRVFELTRLDRVYAEVDVSVTLPDGTTATPAFVDVAVLALRARPDATTTWTTGDYAAGTVTVLLAGPDADPTGALAVPSTGGDLWVRVTDVPEVQAVQAARITIN